MTPRRIPVAEPVLSGNERTYVNDCLDSGWISSAGKYVGEFERRFAEYCGVRHAISTSNGTVALHLALLAAGIGPGDEVIVPDLTYVASANAVRYCGAKPIFADVDPRSWTVNPDDVKQRITSKTRAIIPVHLYGHPADLDPIAELASDRGIFIIEDAAEAHGAEYRGRRVGGIGDLGVFSFYGNKIITTGEGGMVVTDHDDLAQVVRLLRGQGMDPQRRYWFPVVGYNYRLTNLQSAIGVAQLERIDWFIERRREVARWYTENLRGTLLQLPNEAGPVVNVFWMYSVVVPDDVNRDYVMEALDKSGIETRPFFYPMHVLPPYSDESGDRKFPVSTSLGRRGINLPSSATLTHADVDFVCEMLLRALQNARIGAAMP